MCQPFTYTTTSCLNSAKWKCVYAWLASLAMSAPLRLSKVDGRCYMDMADSSWLLLYLPITCFFLPLGNF